ncbi:hypothetical protein IB286_07675 [Spongiibacter sp. KMU-158]|uniref:Cytochrome c domain-containing protein n=1 Tax=Spongiibacter pelagi TaxID=2760804 RepID=A0A927GVY5_9GAMM|nr:hypothetical protein [Spongiibacter pelagi]MBD2858890.1 hypothetical protein [Spongiibacter pelagi]
MLYRILRNATLRSAALSITTLSASLTANAFVYDDDPNALLGSSRGGLAMLDYCYGKSDDTLVPTDPRSLVQPGISNGKAVHFNAYWAECHADPEAVQEYSDPNTCGELRSQWYAGEKLMDTGSENVAALFASNNYRGPESAGGISTFSAEQYNMLWTIWGGYTARPANFDELVSNRYGTGMDEERNPYPLPGEDPNQTNGGSGQLPEMFTQLRETDGSWSGRIGVTCNGCHSGEVGSKADGDDLGFLFGGSSATDLNLFLRDMYPLGYMASGVTPLNLTQTRGTNNASAVNIAFLFPMEGFPNPYSFMQISQSGSTGSMDSPNWWNMGHRPLKFVDGLFPMDAPRVDSVFYAPFFGLFGGSSGPLGAEGQSWMREHGPQINRWVESLKAPKYPMPVNTELAEQGAVLFHELNMWDESRNNAVRQPEGNGSCASCHGAYAPRYVNNEDYLSDPRLEGMAGYIVPLEIIGTDERRVLTNTEGMQQAGADNFFGYPPTKGAPQGFDCGPQGQERIRGDREIGYLAQPLYGVWASAPYLHNGSVPTVWEILKPQDRHPIWRRKSAPAPAGSASTVVMGFDTNLQRAYDSQKMGWKYDKIQCNAYPPMVTPFYNCDPFNIDNTPYPQQMKNIAYGNMTGAWNIDYPPIVTNEHMENRKIYNSHLYSQGNGGHEFTAVLTDAERYAIIEYLKTL